MTYSELEDLRTFIRSEEHSDMTVEMDITMSNDKTYHVDAYSTHCFAEESDETFLVIYGENLKYLSQEHVLAVEVLSKDKE